MKKPCISNELESSVDFQFLKGRWADKSFPSFDKDEFEHEFNQLLDDTLTQSQSFSSQVRAEILSFLFDYHKLHLRYTRSRYFKDVLVRTKGRLFSAIIELLDPGFGDEEITIDLIEEAYNFDILDAMLKAGINPNSKFQSGIESVTRKDEGPKMFDRLVEAGANIDLLVEGKIRSGLLDFKYLDKIYQKGVNINVIDKEGNTPFFYIDDSCSLDLLNKAGCKINQVNHLDDTALSAKLKEAYEKNQVYDLKGICSSLIAHGANIHCPPNPVPLLMRLPGDIDSSGTKSVLSFIEFLVKKKVSLDEKDPKTGNTALHHWAGTDGKISRKICEKLISVGANIHALNNLGQTPLMYAAERHAEKSFKLLISKKTDINARSANSYSVSEWSVARGERPPQSFLQILLKEGAPLDGSASGCDRSLLGFFIQNNHCQALTILESGAEITDWVIDTMTTQNKGSHKAALTAVATFIGAAGKRAKEALNTSYKDDIEELLSEVPDIRQVSPLTRLARTSWPPIYEKREKIVIENIKISDLDPAITFDKGEYEKFIQSKRNDYSLTSGSRSYEKIKGDAGNDESIITKVNNLKNNQSISFIAFIKAINDTLSHLWNEQISKNTGKLYAPQNNDKSPISSVEFRYLTARCGASIVSGHLMISKIKPDMICRALLPVADVRIAPLMASRLSRTSVTRQAKKWLLRHPEHAIHGLIPIAIGKLGKKRDQCEAALRFIASQGQKQRILDIAKGYSAEVALSVGEILSVAHSVDYHPKNPVDIPDVLLLKGSLPLPLVKESGNSLELNTLPVLAGMMSLSTYDDVYPELNEILPLLDEQSLADFAWMVFKVWDEWSPGWENHDKKLKKDAEWMYHCLGYMGNDDTVRKLVPYTKSWPQEGGMAKAITALDIMANSGSDFAIRTINSILQKTKYKPLLERAGEIMETVADVRGLTKEQLDDRLVPDFGLESPGAQTLDFGSRTFTVEINEKLVPVLKDENGKTVKTLPRANKADDKIKVKAATELWKTLKAGLKTEASTQLRRYEQAMLGGRCWSGDDFKTLLVEHPVLTVMVRRLIWAVAQSGKKKTLFFRVNDNGIYLDSAGNEVTVPAEAEVYLPHPLQFEKEVDTWKEVLVKHKLKQPFSQVTRQIYRQKNDADKDFFGINGAQAPAKAFRGLKAKGWTPDIEDAGTIWGYNKSFVKGSVRISFDGIVTMSDIGMDEDLSLEISTFGKLTDIEFSEVIREIKELIH